jgi:hypothetical protein
MLESALKPAVVLYREEQYFAPWVYGLFGIIGFRILFPDFGPEGHFKDLHFNTDPKGYIVFLVMILIMACFLRMATEVSPTGLCVSFGWLPIYRMNIPISQIQAIETSTYRPLRDCLGWGIRRNWQGQVVLSARGSQGVKITRTDGSVVIVGSQKSDQLATAIEDTRRTMMI